jgi:hypothetical protein
MTFCGVLRTLLVTRYFEKLVRSTLKEAARSFLANRGNNRAPVVQVSRTRDDTLDKSPRGMMSVSLVTGHGGGMALCIKVITNWLRPPYWRRLHTRYIAPSYHQHYLYGRPSSWRKAQWTASITKFIPHRFSSAILGPEKFQICSRFFAASGNTATKPQAEQRRISGKLWSVLSYVMEDSSGTYVVLRKRIWSWADMHCMSISHVNPSWDSFQMVPSKSAH